MRSTTPPYVAVVFVLTVVIAVAFRLPSLEERPMHGDEANQAVKTGILLEKGEYEYDPTDHHGPTLYYAALLAARVRGESTLAELSEPTLRSIPALFGLGLLFLLWPLRKAMGSNAILCAALLLAVSPPYVYYSRYFIQESLLVFFMLAMLVSAWRYTRNPSYRWALATGASVALMQATKETAVLAYAALAIAAFISLRALRPSGERIEAVRSLVNPRHLLAACGLGTVIFVVLYSSFFTHARGPLDAVLTYGNYLSRAEGGGIHDKPWHYYLATLAFTHRGPGPIWTEAFPLLLAAIGLAIAVLGRDTNSKGKSGVALFSAIFTVALGIIYSLIPYKTPWSLLSFYLGAMVLAGLGAAWLLERPCSRTAKIIVAILLLGGWSHLAIQSHRTSFDLPADPRNPYVYAHTSTAHLQLIAQIENVSAFYPDGKEMQINVIQPDRDYWPLPWYLRAFPNVGYWDAIPEPADAPVIICAPGLYESLEPRLEDTYMGITGGLRPSVLRTVLIRQDLWDAFVETRR